MKKVLIFLLINFNCFSQQKAFDKERLTYLSKKFIVNEVLGGPKTKPQKVFIDALAATNSKELTTIYYESKVLNI